MISAFSPVINFTTAVCRFAGEEFSENNTVEIYPNPVSDIATISFNTESAENISISIIDLTGRVVKSISSQHFQSGENKITVDLSELNNGIYFVQIKSNAIFYSSKLIKNI